MTISRLRRLATTLKIVSRRSKQIGAVTHPSNREIAGHTQMTTHLPGLMIVVNVSRFVAANIARRDIGKGQITHRKAVLAGTVKVRWAYVGLHGESITAINDARHRAKTAYRPFHEVVRRTMATLCCSLLAAIHDAHLAAEGAVSKRVVVVPPTECSSMNLIRTARLLALSRIEVTTGSCGPIVPVAQGPTSTWPTTASHGAGCSELASPLRLGVMQLAKRTSIHPTFTAVNLACRLEAHDVPLGLSAMPRAVCAAARSLRASILPRFAVGMGV